MKNYLLLMMAVVLAACSSLQTVSFDRLQAGEVNFPDGVRKVAVVNNMPAFVADGNRETISAELEADGRIAAEALASNIADVDYFDVVVVCDSTLRAGDDTLRIGRLLTGDEVKRLVDGLGVDMILSLDRVGIKTQPDVLFYSDYGVSVGVVDVTLTPVVRAYVPDMKKPLFVVAKVDSVMWDFTPGLTDGLIMKEGAEYAATIPMKYLLPHWESVNRAYYTGGSVEMRDAAVYLCENDWDEAYALWKTVYDKKRKGRSKMQAAFNIALYHEMGDDIAQAREWLDKARQLAKPASEDEALMALYAAQLSDRAEKLARLRIQMKRFDEKF